MTHALLNHLWQSTVFAVAAGLLSLMLRKNGPHIRYRLWFVASCKFLIPFSLLSDLGSHLSWRTTPVAPLPPMLGQIAQPFSITTTAVALPVASVVPVHDAVVNPPLVWAALWACGTIAVGVFWMVRWLRLRRAVRGSAPASLDAPISVRSSRMLIEPGVVGLFRPVLLLPDGISERLTPQQLRTILTHEMCHVRRRDNLTAAIHMLVEALFWYHPLVWWLGRQMIVEREDACDEAVITTGDDREAYAEALITVCKFYVESPLASAAGVAGADLNNRIERIMTPRITYTLNPARKILLAVASTATILAPIAIGSALATAYRAGAQTDVPSNASFQSVSIQESQPGGNNLTLLVGPDSFRTSNYSLRRLIAWAFDMQSALISGPDTLDAKYDVDAAAPAAVTASGYLTMDAARSMVRSMLADQFRLQVHRGTQSVSAYVLTESGGGTHFQVALPAEHGPVVRVGPTSISGNVLRMKDIVDLLAQHLGHPVLDQTGLTQTYDFKLDWTADSTQAAIPVGEVSAIPPNPSAEVLARALQAQLGMTLQSERTPAEVLVVDHVQSPKGLVAAPKAVPMDPKLFDSYVGHYALPGGVVMSVSRDNEHLWTQLPGQPPVEMFPEGQGNFFAKVVNAQISFLTDVQGQVSGLELHQNGRNIPAPRMDEATAKQMAAALDKKVQQQTATPGSEEAVRQLMQEFANGNPNYDRMSFGLAEATRQQLPVLRPWFASLGSLVSLKFTSVDPQGADTYLALFEHGAVECHIRMAQDAKIDGAFVRPLPEGEAVATKEHREIAVNPHLFDGYVGSYELAPNFILTVTREADRLFVQATGQSKFEVFAEGDRTYFYKVVDAQITFVTDSSGRTTELILHQNGLDQHAKRIE